VKVSGCTCGFLLLAAVASAQDVPPPATQIAGAVLAAPEERRAGARVLGWDAAGKVVTLREGTNEQVCIADNPKVDGFNVSCYHKDLEAFMARGRELTAQGVTDDKQRDATRWKEVDDKKLAIGKDGFLTVLQPQPDDSLRDQVERAAEMCPTGAITVAD
jgi:ferredoxin